MKLIRLTFIALQIAIFFGISMIMLFDNVISLFTALLVIFLIGALLFISKCLQTLNNVKDKLDHKV